jgi:ubiquinone/menaquinone biosynthesis C-methylase UbiE
MPSAGPEPDEHTRRAARTYSAAADHYCLPALGFWDRYGAATVARLPLAPGQAVLDLCCGAGASAIPAARAVGPDGRVLGIDVAAPLLKLARTKARLEGLANIGFRRRDAARTGLPSGSYDAVVCVFGVFFAADMAAFIAEMWRLVRPGGTLAVTTWGPGLFEPASSLFWTAVREIEPALDKAFNPWDEITTPQALTDLFARGGIDGAVAHAMPGEHRLERPGDFWDVVLGSGYRATVDDLADEQREILRERLLLALEARSITTLRTDVVFATAHRPLAS